MKPLRALAVGGSALGGLAAGVGVAAARRHAAVRAAAPELRHPAAYVPVPVVTDAMVRAARRMPMPSADLPGVERGEQEVEVGMPAGDGPPRPEGPQRPRVRVVTYDPHGRVPPGASRSGALLWIHGGGTVLGAPEIDDLRCAELARRLQALVVSVDYRLAPEHPFPAALDDCAAALAWLHDRAQALGVDPARIAVGGASAGGGLAACLAQRAHDEGGPPIAFQLLVYPMLDDRTVRPHPTRGRLLWTPTLNRYGWRSYLGAELGRTVPPYAAAARREDLRGLPPAWIGVGDLDLFYEEDVAYARRLGEADVDATLHIVRRMYHGADALVPDAPLTLAFVDRMVDALRPHVSAR